MPIFGGAHASSPDVSVWQNTNFAGSYASAIPPAARGLTWGQIAQMGVINAGLFIDPYNSLENSTMIQAVLDFAHDVAVALQGTSTYDGWFGEKSVRVYFPRGTYWTNKQIVVPELVDIDCDGSFVATTGGSGSVFAATPLMPIMVFVPRSNCRKLQVNCNHVSNGVVFGKAWSVATISGIAGAGTGHAVNDVITLANASVMYGGNAGATVTVTSIGAGGSITGYTLTNVGVYSSRPAKNGNTLAQVSTTGTGVGASFSVTWLADFIANANGYKCYQTGPNFTMRMTVDNVRVVQAVAQTTPDATYGAAFGIQIAQQDCVCGKLQAGGGYVACLLRCSDFEASLINVFESWIGLALYGATHCNVHYLEADSQCYSFLDVDFTNGATIKGRYFWVDDNEAQYNGNGPSQSGYAVRLGSVGNGNNALDIQLIGDNTGNVAGNASQLYAAHTYGSSVKLETTNKFKDGTALTKFSSSFVTFGANWDVTNLVKGRFEGITGSPFVGTIPLCAMDIVDASVASVAMRVTEGGVYRITGSGVPTNGGGGTGAGKAPVGSRYFDTAAGNTYTNIGTAASPMWVGAASEQIQGTTTSTAVPTNSTNYWALDGSTTSTTTEANRQLPTLAGTFEDLVVVSTAASGAGQSISFTLMVNGVASAITCSLADGSTITCSDLFASTGHVVTVNDGDLVDLRTVSSATAGTPLIRWTIRYRPLRS